MSCTGVSPEAAPQRQNRLRTCRGARDAPNSLPAQPAPTGRTGSCGSMSKRPGQPPRLSIDVRAGLDASSLSKGLENVGPGGLGRAVAPRTSCAGPPLCPPPPHPQRLRRNTPLRITPHATSCQMEGYARLGYQAGWATHILQGACCMPTVLKAAGAVAHMAAGVEREPHLVQLAPEVLQLPGHQVLQPPDKESALGWGGGRRVRTTTFSNYRDCQASTKSSGCYSCGTRV